MQQAINWKASASDAGLIDLIADRFRHVAAGQGTALLAQPIQMDLTACHLNGTPLRLIDLLDAADFDLVHDVEGIRHNIDRETGRLGGCFLPRFAVPL